MGKAWVFDALDEATPLDTTGGHTWPAARHLAEYLSAAADQLGLSTPGVHILELGAGTGWLGVTVARNLPAAALVCLTEQPGDGLAHLQRNVELNLGQGMPLDHVRLVVCDWREIAEMAGDSYRNGAGAAAAMVGASDAGCTNQQVVQLGEEKHDEQQQRREQQQQAVGTGREQLSSEIDLAGISWDFIIGSDLVYNHVGSRCLPRVLAAFADSSTCIIYCHTRHRYDLLDAELFTELEACGLRSLEVRGRRRNAALVRWKLERQVADSCSSHQCRCGSQTQSRRSLCRL